MPVPKQYVLLEPWVIRDKINNRFIVGRTANEPRTLSEGVYPRLFPNEDAAKAYLGQWLRGALWKGPSGTVQCSHNPNRKRQNMEIVQLQLVRVPD